jgi:hypothetical protein
MRPILGLILANLLFIAAGAGVLVALGIVRLSARNLLAAGGLALVTGVAAATIVQIVLLVLGIDVRFTTGAVVCVLIAATGIAFGVMQGGRARRTAPPGEDALLDDAPPRAAGPAPALVPPDGTPATATRGRLARLTGGSAESAAGRVLAIVAGAVVAVFVYRSVQAYDQTPVANFDEFAIWSKKAFALYYLGGLDPSFFANASLNPIHLEYPILLPAFEAFLFRGMGRLDVGLVHVELLILLVAIVWALGWMVARERRNWLWLPVLVALFVSPFAQVQQVSGLADITMASFAALGVLALAQWLDRDDRALLLLGALFLGAAANTKVEGLLTAAVALGIALVIVLVSRQGRGRVLSVVLAGVVVLALALPWQIWVKAHPDIQTFFDYGKALSPSYMLGRLNLVPIAWRQLDPAFAEPTSLLFLVPIAFAMAIVAIATGVDRVLALFYLLLSVAVVGVIVWIFVAQPGTWSAGRVISVPAMVAIVALVHLGARTPLTGAPAAAEPEREPVAETAVAAR